MSGTTEGAPAPDEPNPHAVETPTPQLEPEPQEPEAPSDPAPPDPAPEPQPDKPEKKPWFVERIARESQRAAALQAEIERLRATQPPPSETPALPTDAAGIEAEIERRAALKRQQDDFTAAWTRTTDAGRKEFKDFDAALSRINDAVGDQFNRQPWIFEALNDLPNGAAVLHSLSQDLGEATRLMGLTPIKQALALSRMSAELAPKPKTVSNAPAPISPIAGAAVHETNDPDKMPMSEWLTWRQKQLPAGRR